MIKKQIYSFFGRLGLGTKPDFIIVGAQKAGTTGLYNTLMQHEKLCSGYKEVHYFDNDEWYSANQLNDYHACFPLKFHLPDKGKTFEATPIYLYHPDVPRRMYNYNPDLKLIVVLRNPAERALSAWTMYHHHFRTGKNRAFHDSRSFAQAISEEIEGFDDLTFYNNKKGYVRRGIYYEQLIRLFDYFPREQVLILESDDVRSMNLGTSTLIQSFIGVDFQNLVAVLSNRSKVDLKTKYQSELEKLNSFFAPYNEKLYDLLKINYNWNK